MYDICRGIMFAEPLPSNVWGMTQTHREQSDLTSHLSFLYSMQYISVYNATYYCPLSFSQNVSAVHGHHQVSLSR
jgi:hypothetical protein